jgi:putative membrane protein
MMLFVARFMVTPVVLLFAAYLIPGVEVSGIYSALVVAILLGVINITLRPLLILLTLPITILTLGLFTFVINALLLWSIASFVEGFAFTGFWPAFVTALLVSVANWAGHHLIK